MSDTTRTVLSVVEFVRPTRANEEKRLSAVRKVCHGAERYSWTLLAQNVRRSAEP